MTHDVVMAYEIQKHIILKIKSKLTNISKVEYYFDGCAGQYKNQKKIFQLVPTDFGIEAKWMFFATSHGKQPCNGIGGTVKCLTAKASCIIIRY